MFHHKRWWLLGGCVVILLGAAGVFIFNSRGQDPVPPSLRHVANFPIYYPTALTGGYHINKQSFSYTGQVFTYYAQNSRNDKLFFSIQPTPDRTGLADFNSRVLQDKVNVLSNAGQAAVGTINGKAVGNLVAGKSWVLITSSDNSASKTIADALANLQQE